MESKHLRQNLMYQNLKLFSLQRFLNRLIAQEVNQEDDASLLDLKLTKFT